MAETRKVSGKRPLRRNTLDRLLQDDPRLKGSNRNCFYRGERISLSSVNVLPQPRQTFEYIDDLAEDIARKNLLNPPVVAEFGRSTCQQYLDVINVLWKTDFQISDLTVSKYQGKMRWFVLLAGERRFRACRHLWQNGCETCREKHGQEPEGRCFRRHFGSSKIDVRLCQEIAPISALFLQFSENTHMRVPPHEEAQAYIQLLKLLRQVDDKYPLARFARNVGRSPEAIRNAVRFCELPIKTQQMVEKGIVVYGIAVEIARLMELDGLKEHELEWWVARAVTGRYKVSEFREVTNHHLAERRSGQGSLLEMMEDAQKGDLHRRQIKRVVESQTLLALHAFCGYLAKICRLCQEGKLGRQDSLFSMPSITKIFIKLLETQVQLLPLLLESLTENESNKIARLIDQLKG